MQNATNINIKEKHEADLKKEIKKLQVCEDLRLMVRVISFFLQMYSGVTI